MPKKIKIFLTTYILFLFFIVTFFESKFGQSTFILIVTLLAFFMVLGIWIFPEVVTKKDNQKTMKS